MMRRRRLLPAGGLLLGVVVPVGGHSTVAPAQAIKRGVIRGHVRLTGKEPGNPIIRMGMDPKCAAMNAGKRRFRPTRSSSTSANACTGLASSVRVGQILLVRNDDDLLHNVHSLSGRGNGFNVSQPKAGIVQQFRLKDEETTRTSRSAMVPVRSRSRTCRPGLTRSKRGMNGMARSRRGSVSSRA